MFFDSKELKDAISKNPALPLVFIVNNELYYDEAYQSFAKDMKIKVGKVTKEAFNDLHYNDPDMLHEAIWENLSSNSDYECLTDSEFNDLVENEFAKYEWQEAIIIYLE